MIITIEWLKKHRACEEGIVFFERNFLSKELDLDSVEIEGDYKDYFNWIEEELFYKWKYDIHGNCIEKKYSSGDIYKFKYYHNNEGNLIKIEKDNKVILKIKYRKNK